MDFKRFRPKRSAARWLQDAPADVIACYDNGGKTADRYTVLFGGKFWTPGFAEHWWKVCREPRMLQHLGMSAYPSDPQGVSMWGEDAMRGPHLGRKVRWLDLPENIRKHTVARMTQGD